MEPPIENTAHAIAAAKRREARELIHALSALEKRQLWRKPDSYRLYGQACSSHVPLILEALERLAEGE